jgi:glycosyltransferase involved in cell wall biosynthesis
VILTAESDHDRPRFETSRREWDGIPIHQVIHNYTWDHFQETYDCPEADNIFRRVLREEQPDVVHIQHLHYFSANFVTIARSRGIPVVYTLHDYMLLCPRDGLMMRADGEICERPIPAKCADCIAHLPLAPTPTPPLPRALRPGADALLPEGVARELLRTRTAADPEQPHAAAIAERLDYLKRVLRDVDLFISPSEFLRDRFAAAGLVDADQIVVSDNGYELSRYAPSARRMPREELRLGYVGTIAEHKGLHVLIEALEGIDDPRISCRIWGNLDAFIEYSDRLRGLVSNPRTLLMGPVPPEGVARVLATTDVLVIPSLWYENAPLTVHEAALAGIPVIASDLGGLAEYVQEGITGLRFRVGDAGDLRAKILSFLEEPGPLPDFRPTALEVKSIADDAAAMERRYEQVLTRRAGVTR